MRVMARLPERVATKSETRKERERSPPGMAREESPLAPRNSSGDPSPVATVTATAPICLSSEAVFSDCGAGEDAQAGLARRAGMVTAVEVDAEQARAEVAVGVVGVRADGDF